MATKPRTKRITKPVYEPVIKLPPLRYEDFVALRDNIAVNGVLVPILVDSDGPKRKIIDGNYRKQIANELGYDCPEIVHDTDTGGFLRMWQLGLDQEVGQWKPSTGTHRNAPDRRRHFAGRQPVSDRRLPRRREVMANEGVVWRLRRAPSQILDGMAAIFPPLRSRADRPQRQGAANRPAFAS